MSHLRRSFYDMMHYPVPRDSEQFFWGATGSRKQIVQNTMYSRDECSDQMQEYVSWINKRSRIFRCIPGIETMYLCNSLTFNALHETSDIDVMIVTTPDRLWTARFFSWLFLTLCGLRRWRRSGIRKKFCLSFYIDQHHQNLYPLSCADDVYLVYWIAHLVPVYERTPGLSQVIRSQNRRIYEYLSGLEVGQHIFLGIMIQQGSARVKRWLEYRMHGYVGRIGERIIRSIWMPVVLLKKRLLGPQGRSQIISFAMLKFHHCVRAKIAYMWKKYRTHM